jgi:hypothetical protein
MTALGKSPITVTQVFRRLRGGSQPVLVQASDGLFYVVKFLDNFQGSNVLFNESAGTELFQASGLPVPSWTPLVISDEFLDRNPLCWMQGQHGPIRPHAGLCYGSRFLGLDGIQSLEILSQNNHHHVQNRESFWLAWLLDVCSGHTDNRQVLFTEDSRGDLHPSFIDHGHLFGGPEGNETAHLLSSRYLDWRIYPETTPQELQRISRVVHQLDTDKIWTRILALPDEWKSPSALAGFNRSLDRLAQPLHVQGVLDAMRNNVANRRGRDEDPGRIQRKPPLAVLYPGICATFQDPYRAADGAGRLARVACGG